LSPDLINEQSLGFDPNAFGVFLPSTIPKLIQLMGEAETLESKRKVAESLNTIIEQSGSLVSWKILPIAIGQPQQIRYSHLWH
jgi:hypothetical protein